MRKLSGSISAAVVMTALLFALSGCQKQEGSAEKAGKEIVICSSVNLLFFMSVILLVDGLLGILGWYGWEGAGHR